MPDHVIESAEGVSFFDRVDDLQKRVEAAEAEVERLAWHKDCVPWKDAKHWEQRAEAAEAALREIDDIEQQRWGPGNTVSRLVAKTLALKGTAA